MKHIINSNNQKNKIDVYLTLKNAIQYLDLKPGEQIVEADLSAEFGISRTPIREALVRLSDELLVEIRPQSGTYVTKIDFALSKEVAYMRHVLETEIFMKLCSEKANLKDLLAEKVYLMKLALDRNDTIEYINRDAEFHRAIFAYANHEFIWDIINNTRSHYIRTLVLDMSLPSHLNKSFKSHKMILDCIQDGKTKELMKIMEEHHDYRKSSTDKKIMLAYPQYFKISEKPQT